ncbi:MAG: hypothetical protein ACYDH0_05090 [Candidatus Aminicenantales bacterium]
MKTSLRVLMLGAGIALAITAGSYVRAEEPVFTDLPKPGKTCKIGEDYTFTYEFDKTPKMGTVILKIQLFDTSGEQTTALGITGRADMPAMAGAHDSGEVAFKLNKKGDYLLPVSVVMPGEWEVRLVFSKGEDVVFRGRFKFDV